jgi:putative spermidine/putrescine transport system ATP-binding protein
MMRESVALTRTLGRPVHFRGIGKSFGATVALRDVTLDIAPGEFCTILGPSGSGKTTLLKLVAGFEEPTTGALDIGGRSMVGVPVAKRNIGVVFQNYALFPHMTVRDNIAFPLEMRGMTGADLDARIASILTTVDLDGYGERYPRQLSGGQQQRVALARALVFEPDLLLMDEPLGALDKNLRHAIQHELRDLHRKLGVTVIYVTHDQEEALFLSDRIVVMQAGAIAQVGRPAEIYERPRTEFVARFLGDCNLFDASVARVDGDHVHLRVDEAADLALPLEGANVPQPGAALRVGIRPERLSLAPAGATALGATITDIIFSGANLIVTLDWRGRTLTARLDSRAPVPGGIGDTVSLVLPPRDAFLVPIG